jgi:hypothetical protein
MLTHLGGMCKFVMKFKKFLGFALEVDFIKVGGTA